MGWACFLGLAGCGAPEMKLQKQYGEAMGTTLMLAYYAPAPQPALFDKAVALLDQLESELTIWGQLDAPTRAGKAPSAVEILNAAAGKEPVALPPDSTFVLRTALKYARLSQGALDPTIGPLVQAWGIATSHPSVPTGEVVTARRGLVDWTALEDRPEGFFLPRPGMMVDLGAIAKGYAADKLKTLLINEGFSSGIVDLGGNVFLVGAKTDGQPWRVGVQDPLEPRGTYLGVLPVKDKSLVTSGIYERYFEENGKTYHHILDPKTGYPANHELAGVTIVHNPSMEADALSTSVFVLGLKRGWELVRSQPEVEAIFVTRDRKIWITPGLVGSFELSGEYTLQTGEPL